MRFLCKNWGGGTAYYTTSDCTGTAYIDKTLDTELLIGEKGVVGALGNMAVYQPMSATPVNNVVVNSMRQPNGTCVSLAEYTNQPKTEDCQNLYDEDYYGDYGRVLDADTRVKEIPSGSYKGEHWVFDKGTGDWVYYENYTDEYFSCQILGWPIEYWYYEADYTVDPVIDIEERRFAEAPKINKELRGAGIFKTAYAVYPNNPSVTGITTEACVDPRKENRPAVCISGATLKSE